MRSRKRRCAHQPTHPSPSSHSHPLPCPTSLNRGCATRRAHPLCTMQIQIIIEKSVAEAITSQAMIPIEITPPSPLQRKEMASEEQEVAVCTSAYTPLPLTSHHHPPPCLTSLNRGCATRRAPPLCTMQIQIIIEKSVAEAITSQANQEASMIPIEITPPSPLQRKFDALVMCNFTPRKPGTLPVSRWVSCANTATRAARGLRPPTPLQIH